MRTIRGRIIFLRSTLPHMRWFWTFGGYSEMIVSWRNSQLHSLTPVLTKKRRKVVRRPDFVN
jgi:hypothetical protein